jgi:CheY-like chemotaxis protein
MPMPTFTRDEFTKQIRQALENLYDFAYLQNLPLTDILSEPGQSLDASVRQLRAELIDAIERLRPDDSIPPHAKERRPYALLYGRYVQGLGTNELVEELMISVRQLRRENKRALEAVTELMWQRFESKLAAPAASPELTPAVARHEAAGLEAEQLISQASPEDLRLPALVSGVLATLQPVAANHNIQLINQVPDDLPPIRADRVLLRQGLMGVLSFAFSRATEGSVMMMGEVAEVVNLRIKASGQTGGPARGGVSLAVSQKLIAGLGGLVEVVSPANPWQVNISLPLAQTVPILVMDDNAGLLELFRRYLAGRPYHLIEVHSLAEAIAQTRELQPQLVMLDIMMPEQDGWEVLQQLRAAPETTHLPIIICSVLVEPEIATALGASDYLPKPVTQDALLTKLEQWRDAPPALAE